MKNFLSIITIALTTIMLGCGSSTDNVKNVPVAPAKPRVSVEDKLKLQKQGLIVVDITKIETDDKSISISWPDKYIVCTFKKGSEHGAVLVDPKLNESITVGFKTMPKGSKSFYGMPESEVLAKAESLYKRIPYLKGIYGPEKIHGMWFLVDNNNGLRSFSTNNGRYDFLLSMTTPRLEKEALEILNNLEISK